MIRKDGSTERMFNTRGQSTSASEAGGSKSSSETMSVQFQGADNTISTHVLDTFTLGVIAKQKSMGASYVTSEMAKQATEQSVQANVESLLH